MRNVFVVALLAGAAGCGGDTAEPGQNRPYFELVVVDSLGRHKEHRGSKSVCTVADNDPQHLHTTGFCRIGDSLSVIQELPGGAGGVRLGTFPASPSGGSGFVGVGSDHFATRGFVVDYHTSAVTFDSLEAGIVYGHLDLHFVRSSGLPGLPPVPVSIAGSFRSRLDVVRS